MPLGEVGASCSAKRITKESGMKDRFCRASVLKYLEEREKYLRESNRFDFGNGWSQVNGKGEEKNRAYGEWRLACELIEEFSA
jgi:hypothetical protein